MSIHSDAIEADETTEIINRLRSDAVDGEQLIVKTQIEQPLPKIEGRPRHRGLVAPQPD
jgi:hypothetical protein